MLPSSEATAVDGNGDDDQPSPSDEKPREPPKRFNFSPEMKELFRQILDNSSEMSSFNQKAM